MVIANSARKDSTHVHHQMVNTKIRLFIFFAANDGETLYSQDWELTVAQIMNSLLQNSEEELKDKLKKVGETIRSFRYDLNQICYYHRVEVTMPRTKG